jgi:hypothetical protein
MKDAVAAYLALRRTAGFEIANAEYLLGRPTLRLLKTAPGIKGRGLLGRPLDVCQGCSTRHKIMTSLAISMTYSLTREWMPTSI